MVNKHILIIGLCLYHYTNAQQRSFSIPDSLSTKDYEYFQKNIHYKEQDNSKELLYAQAWLTKAKKEKNFSQMAIAYKALLYRNGKKLELIYAENMVTAAKHTTDTELIGSAYFTKGVIYYDHKEHIKALDNYLIADEYISKTNNRYLIYKVKYGIGQIKYYLGFYDEAIALLNECVNYYKGVNNRAYLNSLHTLGLCYNRIGKYNLCTQMNQLGLNEGRRLKNSDMQFYFIESEGVNQYFKHNYGVAIKDLTIALPALKHNNDFANETLVYFYIGKSYWSLKLVEKALPYFKKVDDAFQKQNYIRPDLRQAYELLIDYYQQQNNKEQELYYVRTLSKVDRLIHKDFKYLSPKIDKEYDTKKLLQIQKDNEQYWIVIGSIIISILTIIIAFFVNRHYRHKRLFKELMNRKPDEVKTMIAGNSSKEIEQEISHEVLAAILKNLEKFERNKKYLGKDMVLSKIASILKTNTKYASKVISRYRGKGSIEYISDLKIDHIVELLKTENLYRNYTNKALGEEVGFGSTHKFTKAFIKRTGLSPTYFISQLKNQSSQ